MQRKLYVGDIVILTVGNRRVYGVVRVLARLADQSACLVQWATGKALVADTELVWDGSCISGRRPFTERGWNRLARMIADGNYGVIDA